MRGGTQAVGDPSAAGLRTKKKKRAPKSAWAGKEHHEGTETVALQAAHQAAGIQIRTSAMAEGSDGGVFPNVVGMCRYEHV